MKARAAIILGVISLAAASVASAQHRFGGNLAGFQEVPVISTAGNGRFDAVINRAETEISYELSYSDMEGTVQQAHIHIGQRDVNGGITVFLCTNLGNGPVGTQACPPSPATITGVITADDVSPPILASSVAIAQGLGTGEFAELLNAMRSGVTYVNVHTATFPGGEIRHQIGDRRP